MTKVLTIGEAMGLLVAESEGPLDLVKHFERHVCGAELNYIVGMALMPITFPAWVPIPLALASAIS